MKPALTAEEWGEVETRPHHNGGSGSSRERYAVFWLEGGGLYLRGEGGAAHGAAAMLLYDQPYGFTREDVRALRSTADDANTTGGAWLESIADRIEALLPKGE